jgi:hypothetical protein
MARKHSDSGVQKARDTIRAAAEAGDTTAQRMLRGVERDEAREERHGEDAVQRP